MTCSHDSIFLHGVVPSAKEKILFHDKFVTKIGKKNGKSDFVITDFMLTDLNRDGHKEIISGIMAGFQVQPRFLFTYDYTSDTLMKTPVMGTFQRIDDTMDINGDRYPEFFVQSYAIDNNEGKQVLPYDDNSAWLIAYDRRFRFLFPPVEFKGKYVSMTTLVIGSPQHYYIVGLYGGTAPGAGPPRLMLFNTAGQLLKTRILDDTSRTRGYGLYTFESRRDCFWLLHEGGVAEEMDQGLEVKKRKRIESLTTVAFYPLDIDGDGEKELIFPGSGGSSFTITRADFSNPAGIINPFEQVRLNFSVKKEAGMAGSLFIQGGNRYILCAYGTNPWYYLRWPVYLALYAAILAFIMLVRFIQRRTFLQMVDAENKIAEMQLLLFRNQLDPHFTFNAINSISASILLSKPEEANRNLLALARLMRSCVLQSDKLSRSLAEELDFLQNYLDLMKARSEQCFEYHIETDDTVDLEWQVPRMVTQIYVENAIRHGLKPKKGPGVLDIRVSGDGKNIRIVKEDNGVGRKKAGSNGSEGTGRGMEIMDQSFHIFNKFNQKKIHFEITDLENEEGLPCGTRVMIMIPVGMKYRFYREGYH
ncbi:MAG: histidine kinase [Bacteroidota bacterium]